MGTIKGAKISVQKSFPIRNKKLLEVRTIPHDAQQSLLKEAHMEKW